MAVTKIVSLTNGFNPDKLVFMRELKNYSLRDVSELSQINYTTINKFEKGSQTPNFLQITKLADVFRVSHKFFLNGINLPTNSGTTFYRKLVKVPKKKYQQAERQLKWEAILESQISNELELQYGKLPKFANFNNKFDVLDVDYIESMARDVRKLFEIGEGPISNMTLLVEKLGFRVIFDDYSSEHIDALTDQLDGHYYIGVNKNNRFSVRIRFDLAHELGHILLHSNYKSTDIENKSYHSVIESEANLFAGALLMPDTGLAMDMISTNMEYLISLKKHWKVSIQAIIYRGNQIGLITDDQALYLRQTIARKGWRKEEPFDKEIPVEYPSFINSALKFKTNDMNEFKTRIENEIGRQKQVVRLV